MRPITRPARLITLAALLTACQAPAAPQAATPVSPQPAANAAPAMPGQGHDAQHAHHVNMAQAQAEQGQTPAEQLDALDTRRPVPLLAPMALHQKQNMRAHLEDVQAVLDALARDDMAGVEAAAKRLGTSPQMQQMCEHMGAGAPGFTDMALAFHEEADTIAAAAQAKDHKAALAATARTLNRCTSCHAAFKQQLVSTLP